MRHNFLTCILVLSCLFSSSCHEREKAVSCQEVVRSCNAYLSKNRQDTGYLDTLLQMVNSSITCDSARPYFVDMKIRVLMSKGSLKECMAFVDSMTVGDFSYPYRKNLMHDYLMARQVQSADSTKFRSMLSSIGGGLALYLKENELKDAALHEALADLITLKSQYADSSSLRREIDSLGQVYPSQANYLKYSVH